MSNNCCHPTGPIGILSHYFMLLRQNHCQSLDLILVFFLTFFLPSYAIGAAPDVPKGARNSTTATSPAAKRLPDFIVKPLEFLRGERPTEGTFVRDKRDFIFCRGFAFKGKPPDNPRYIIRWQKRTISNPGAWNNEILAELSQGDFQDHKMLRAAVSKFRAGLRADPLFFPFQYNLGRIFSMLNLPGRARRFFELARGTMPRFSGAYLNLGRTHAALKEDRAAVYYYKQAARKNPYDLKPLIALGNFYLDRGDRGRSRKFYLAALKKKPNYANAKIGLARLFMHSGDKIRARIALKEIATEELDGSPRRDYDRILHYYLATIAADLRDYRESLRQYNRLLSYKKDPFFLRVGVREIEKRRDIVKRLADAADATIKQ